MNIQAQWKTLSPELEPIGYLLKQVYPDRWVRFHNLPESKRYPETEAEYQTIIDRNMLIFFSLISEGSEIVAFNAEYDVGNNSGVPDSQFLPLVHEPQFYGTVKSPKDPDQNFHIYSGRFDSSNFASLVRLAADEVLPNIILAAFAQRVIYHPYDGGMDFILKSKSERDALREKFIAWYPASTGGF
jgi:hypothetical protein